MSVKSEGAEFDKKLWAEKYNKDTATFYYKCGLPTVNEARGKIVLLRRFGDDEDLNGIKLNFDDDGGIKGDNAKNSGIRSLNCPNCLNPTKVKFAFQDFYDAGQDQSDEKRMAIEQFISFKQNNTDVFTINFTSWTAKNSVGVPFPEKAADVINPWLTNKLLSLGNLKEKLGIVAMDFATAPLIEKIIKTNMGL